MAIDPKLVSIKNVEDLPKVSLINLVDGNILCYDGEGVLKLLDTDEIIQFQNSDSLGLLKTTDTPPTTGKFRGDVMTAGTYTNFKNSGGVALAFTQAELDANLGFIYVVDNVATKALSLKPQATVKSEVIPTNTVDAVSGKAVADYLNPKIAKIDSAFEKASKQLFDKATADIQVGSISPTSGVPNVTNANFRVRFPNNILEVGKTYTLKNGTLTSTSQGKLTFLNSAGAVISFVATTSGNQDIITFTVPPLTENTYIQIGSIVNANTLPLRDNVVVNSVMLNEGSEALPYQSYSDALYLKSDKLPPSLQSTVNFVSTNFYTEPKKNIFDKATMARVSKFWSPATKVIGNNTNYILAVVNVKEGKQYTISGAEGGATGGFITSTEVGVDNIVYSATTGGGKTFTVPTGLGIKKVAINITLSANTTYLDTFQIEESDVATPYAPYEIINVFKGKAELEESGGASPISATSKTYVYPDIYKHFPNFTDHFHAKDKDVVLCMNGTSLLRNYYSTDRNDGSTRPPLMNQNTMATWLWDKLAKKWEGQKYRRSDATSFFTEIGTFTTETGNVSWDDNSYRYGHTRWTAATNASVQFTVPTEAWQFNFIYRTEIAGTEQAKVTIAEGNDKIQAWNGSAWVEANGYIFSMKESVATATKGNTTFQKRLKMRCKGGAVNSIGTTKSVTINNQAGAGRFLYWGVEWSPREFMFTIINASRGSHNWGLGTESLTKFQDNEMWSFNPDLVLMEITMINYGASTYSNMGTKGSNYYTDLIENWYFNLANAESLAAKSSNFTTSEVLFFSDTPSILSAGWETDGSIKYGVNADGKVITVLDSYEKVNGYLLKKDFAFVDVYSRFVEYAEAKYINFYASMQGSGSSTATGDTLSKDGTHWNYNGNRLVADIILPAFDFN